MATAVLQNDMKDGGQSCNKWSVEADVESLAWDPHNEHSFMVSKLNFHSFSFKTC
jgi:periodic tryptophan protein 1